MSPGNSTFRKITTIFCMGLVFTGSISEAKEIYTLPQPPQTGPDTPEQQTLRRFSNAFVDIAKKTRPALVYIESEKVLKMRRGRSPFDDFFFGFPNGDPRGQGPMERLQRGAGSGFIVDLGQGYVITNNHVVDGADKLKVYTYDDREFEAELIGKHKDTDVAVLKLKSFSPGKCQAIAFGDSEKLEVGEWVVALGAPFQLPQTMTVGVISALGRGNVLGESTSIQDFIQTDAAINPGNSGGPLLDLDGMVIGMNTAIYSQTGNFAGIGFAVPSAIVRRVAESLINDGKVERGYLGVYMSEDLTALDLPKSTSGVLITKVVPDSPADKAGMKTYDIIQEIAGEKITDSSKIVRIVALAKPGSSIPVTVLRDGDKKKLNVKIGEAPKGFGGTDDNEGEASTPQTIEHFGLALEPLNKSIRDRNSVKAKNGVFVAGVARGTAAQQAGFRVGDVIIEVNRNKVNEPGDVKNILDESEKNDRSVVFLVERDGQRELLVFRRR